MVIETSSRGRLSGQVVPAGSDRIEALHDVERLAHRPDVGEWTEIPGAIVPKLSGDEYSGERFLDRHLHKGIPFVVPELDIEPGLVFLDKVRLEKERLRLGSNQDRIHLGGEPRQLSHTDSPATVTSEVAPHPRPN